MGPEPKVPRMEEAMEGGAVFALLPEEGVYRIPVGHCYCVMLVQAATQGGAKGEGKEGRAMLRPISDDVWGEVAGDLQGGD